MSKKRLLVDNQKAMDEDDLGAHEKRLVDLVMAHRDATQALATARVGVREAQTRLANIERQLEERAWLVDRARGRIRDAETANGEGGEE